MDNRIRQNVQQKEVSKENEKDQKKLRKKKEREGVGDHCDQLNNYWERSRVQSEMFGIETDIDKLIVHCAIVLVHL